MTTTTSPTTSRLAALSALGTSVWLDLLRRSLYTGEELRRLVEEDSLVGMTSNPSIFQKAILGSEDYDADLRAAAEAGAGAQEIYERLAIADVQAAADVLRPVYDRTDGGDGYVSLEVGPELARDTQGSLDAAVGFWKRLDRPNVMIKIPGTPEGVPAIRDAIAAGVNINITLLFAIDAYAAVADAYMAGLEARLERGEPIDRVASVASFFVSRVDTAIDKRLEALGREDLAGTGAIANARAAYAHYEEIVASGRWARLREHGAMPQRVLWASTSTKNPHYRDVMYVEELAGPDTVNTMPMQTLLAFQEHGEVEDRISGAGEEAQRSLDALRDAGIDMDEVTSELLDAGIEAFEADMGKLLAGIERRRAAVLAGAPRGVVAHLGEADAAAVRERVRDSGDLVRRLWRKDHTLWGPEPAEIADRLGWLDIAEQMLDHVDELEAFAESVRADGLTDVVLLGMGGSSLAPLVFSETFGTGDGGLRLHVLDSTHPDAVAAVPVENTLFIVASKSGTTLEPRSLYEHFRARVEDPSRFVAITDPGTALAQRAASEGFRHCFLAPPDIGGRYSALSFFGLVPAALIGADVRGLLERAEVARHANAPGTGCDEAPAIWLGLALGELARRGRDKLTLVVDEPLGSLGLWLEQLVAESTGKEGTGIVPVAGEPLASQADVYGEDRVFVHVCGEERSLPSPSIALPFDDPLDVGAQMYTWELAVAVAGHVLDINAFDQPNVQEAKDLTNETIAAYERSGELPEIASTAASLGDLEGSYVAILAYLAPGNPDIDAALTELRVALRDARHVATTAGYGPRYLHSTGQLHKGGPPEGAFLLLTDTPRADLPGFAALLRAQAVGDARALAGRDRPLLHVELGEDPAGAIRKLAGELR